LLSRRGDPSSGGEECGAGGPVIHGPHAASRLTESPSP
jgi:hypothetical protein